MSLSTGVRAFFFHRDIDGYRRLSFLQRKRLDMLAMRHGLATAGFWKAVLIVCALLLALETVLLTFDVQDWRADLARFLPLAIVAPWVAAARRRLITRLLDRQARTSGR